MLCRWDCCERYLGQASDNHIVREKLVNDKKVIHFGRHPYPLLLGSSGVLSSSIWEPRVQWRRLVVQNMGSTSPCLFLSLIRLPRREWHKSSYYPPTISSFFNDHCDNHRLKWESFECPLPKMICSSHINFFFGMSPVLTFLAHFFLPDWEVSSIDSLPDIVNMILMGV